MWGRVGSSEVRQAGKIRKHSDLNPAVTSFHSLTPLTQSVTSDGIYYLHLSFLNSFLNALPFPLLKGRNSSFFPRHEWIKKSVNNSLSHLYMSIAHFHVQIFLGGAQICKDHYCHFDRLNWSTESLSAIYLLSLIFKYLIQSHGTKKVLKHI